MSSTRLAGACMKRKKTYAILGSVIDMIMASAKDSHPNEFACSLRAEDGIITEVILVPGTISGNTSAILRLHMLPIDFSIVGTAHSHPSPNYNPSPADLGLFSKYGNVHLIAHYPYRRSSWRAYDRYGQFIDLVVL